jgi:cell division protein FtsN
MPASRPLYLSSCLLYLAGMKRWQKVTLISLFASSAAAFSQSLLAQQSAPGLKERPVWPSPAGHAARASAVTNVAPGPVAQQYVLQVGAFRDRANAARAAASLVGEQVRIAATRRGTQDWYVLLLGSYATEAQAGQARQRYLADYPGAQAWVRSSADPDAAGAGAGQ